MTPRVENLQPLVGGIIFGKTCDNREIYGSGELRMWVENGAPVRKFPGWS